MLKLCQNKIKHQKLSAKLVFPQATQPYGATYWLKILTRIMQRRALPQFLKLDLKQHHDSYGRDTFATIFQKKL